jgi:two-component system chemotaxis sensor kinase CheA
MTEDFDMDMEEMREIIDDFLVEADELIGSLDNNFVKLEAAPDDLDLLNEIFRAIHTVKGTSSFLGFEQVTTLSHRMEDILNKLRKGEMATTAEIMDLLLEGVDLLKVLLDNVRNQVTDPLDLEDILGRLQDVLDDGGGDETSDVLPQVSSTEPAVGGAPGGDRQVGAGLSQALSVSAESVDAQSGGESVVAQSPSVGRSEYSAVASAEEEVDGRKGSEAEGYAAMAGGTTAVAEAPEPEMDGQELQESAEQTPSSPARGAGRPAPKKPGSDPTIRVDVNRLDTLMNMMGELVLGRNSLVQAASVLSAKREGDSELEPINQATKAVNFITTELQMAIMKMRMQPVGKVFNRFPRLVRDLARETGKKIELKISGESTELDRSVIEEIGDPLVHVIRNSCDHGLELPDERVEAGKPETGTVWLSASQEGSNIIIKVRDDGRGLDAERIAAKAVERGTATQAEIDRMSRQDIYKFIFEAGLSTAKQITGISGRGVGMDVVRSNIEKLNGMIEIDSEKGVGTTLTIKLPLTLAIIQGLLVESDDEVFILPLSSVHETVKTAQSEISYVNQRPVIRLRNEIIPIINLNQILNTSRAGFQVVEKPYLVIVGLAEKKLGLMIDHFLGQEEVVIKSLGSYLGSTEGIAGATILGDGRIRLIVDLIGLFNIARKIS